VYDLFFASLRLKNELKMTSIYPRLLLIIAIFSGVSCAPEKPARKSNYVRTAESITEDLELFTQFHIGSEVGEKPWIAHVNPMDLNQDGLTDVVFCDAKHNTVLWLKQLDDGSFEELTIAEDMRAPVHVEPADMDEDGDIDLIVSSMSAVFPNNDKIGAIFILENDGAEHFTPRLIIENIDRVVDARAADFDGDGMLDLAVGQFGYDQGEIRWMRRTGLWEFESEVLLSLSGTINVTISDYDGNGTLDFAALVSQQWEEMHLFFNDGKGNFTNKVVWGSTNEDYSCSGMSSFDINQDGLEDLIFSNGDGFGPSPEPGPKPWHGVQWLENKGNGFFKFHRIGDLGGAYSPMAADLDRDGDVDVVALSSFNDWRKPKAVSMAWFENDGSNRFKKRVLTYTPTHLLTLGIAPLKKGDEALALFTGGFHAYPPYIENKTSRMLVWKKTETLESK
jgi:hypothetical protein